MLIGQICINNGFCYETDILSALGKQSKGDLRKIGEILVTEGRLSESKLKKALDIQKNALAPVHAA